MSTKYKNVRITYDAWLILKVLAAKKALTLRALLDEMAEEKKREAVTNKS